MKIKLSPRKLWTISLVLYIICSSAFSYGSLRMLNTYALYFFLGISLFNIMTCNKVKLNPAMYCIILYALLMFFGMLYTPTSQSAAQGVLYNYVTMAVIVFCVVQYMRSIEDVKTIMFAYMLAGLALAIYVYAQYGNEFWTMMKEATESDVGNVDRLGGGVTNVNTIGMFTMFSALIAAYNIIFDRTTKKKTWFCLAVGIFCFMVSMAAASKKSVVILLVACICIWLYSSLGNKNSEKQLRNFLILIGCTVLFFWMINTLPIFSAISNRLNSLFDSMDGGSGTVSEANRSAFTKKGLSVWLDNFLIGGGTASSIHYLGVYAHNNYVELLMNSGIFGFALFYGIYPMTISKYFTNAITYKRQNKLSILLFSMFICVCVSGIALVYYYERYFMILMTVIFSATEIFDKETFKEVRLEGERV